MLRRLESETNKSIIVIFSRQTKRQLHISGIEIQPLSTCFCLFIYLALPVSGRDTATA